MDAAFDDDNDLAQPRMIHYKTLYFVRGNLIISAEMKDEETTRVFRVNTTLKYHSKLYKSAPIVPLPDDAEDVTRFLRVWYYPAMPLFQVNEFNKFGDAALRMMKLGDKYEVKSICKAVLNHVKSAWPTTLAGLELVKNGADWALLHHTEEINYKPHLDDKLHICEVFPEPASAVRLAKDYDIPVILPAAFYVFAISDPETSWPQRSGIFRDKHWLRTSIPANWDLLDDGDRLRLFRGRDRLRVRVQDIRRVFAGYIVTQELMQVDQRCKEKFKFHDSDLGRHFSHEEIENIMRGYYSACDYALNRYANAFVDDIMKSWFKGHRNDPIRVLDELAHGLHEGWLCATCVPVVRDIAEGKIRDIWQELPKIFDSGDDDQL